ncbi:uncharacterized protein LOC103309478 [Acyrthosiphon pisum]|uniref:Reverse transcriptase domain-containing protein n=1 Tax=Acyrthosiphon pisum TaxID=7029 RepID=A0A8R2F8S7_ACYPI|nr:uncharacterized protein LOC103309478 [Acyrthosiphon pisum]|eukprot:XP_008183215.1 PREDICTED: uncharacterized protein LOC103309478 [Acyrthosiphon pisum]
MAAGFMSREQPNRRSDIRKYTVVDGRAHPVGPTIFQKAEPLINDITQDETDKAIDSLDNWKAHGSDNIQAELIKYSGKETWYFIFNVCQKTWRGEQMRRSWKEIIILPLHKKGVKTDCSNYRGISLLNTAYKVFSKVLLSRLTSYAEECLGEYQCDALSPPLFNLALEKAVRMMQNAESGVAVNEHRVQVLRFSDDLIILGESLGDALDLTMALENAAEKVGLS